MSATKRVKLSAVKPTIRREAVINGRRSPARVQMTLARYRADQRLIRAAKGWSAGYGSYEALFDAIAVHDRATQPSKKGNVK